MCVEQKWLIALIVSSAAIRHIEALRESGSSAADMVELFSAPSRKDRLPTMIRKLLYRQKSFCAENVSHGEASGDVI